MAGPRKNKKVCSTCGLTVSLAEMSTFFHKVSGRNPELSSGYQAKCKQCTNSLAKVRIAQWRLANPERSKERSRKCYNKNKVRIGRAARQKRFDNIESCLQKEAENRLRDKSPEEVQIILHRRWVVSLNSHDRFIYDSFKRWSTSAIYRNLSFHLTFDNILDMIVKQDGKCFYTGSELVYSPNSLFTLSLDRVDSKKGYSVDNCVLCGSQVNLMKLDLSIQEFAKLCKQVSSHKFNYKGIV